MKEEYLKYRISVIMPVFNCGQYIVEALDSILNQTFSDFEVLVIDDCSTDNTVSCIEQIRDNRVVLIKKEKNTGYTNSLNLGIELAKGEFIARMDGDDYSLPSRFEQQLKVFDLNPNVVLCGTAMTLIPGDQNMVFPQTHAAINVALLSGCCLAHPSVMFRREFLLEKNLRYNPNLEPSEDFDLWTRMARFGELHNLEQPLLRYRTHDRQTSELRREEQRIKARRVQENHLSAITTRAVANRFYEVDRVRMLATQRKKKASVCWIERQCEVLARRNEVVNFFDNTELQSFLLGYRRLFIRSVMLTSYQYSPNLLGFYFSLVIRYPRYFTLVEIIKTFVKTLIYYKIRR